MERYKLEIVNNDGDRYVRGEPAPDGSWMMFKDVEARIAELEAALRSIASNTCCDKCQEAALVARAALGEKE